MADFYCKSIKFNKKKITAENNNNKNWVITIKVSGDKSITHRALILAAMAPGISTLKNPSKSEDCLTTIDILKKLGVKAEWHGNSIKIISRGLSQWRSGGEILNCNNSGTTARLLTGVLAGIKNRNFFLTGDNSLRKRPMQRIYEPLSKMGADIIISDNKTLPAAISGHDLKGINFFNKNNSAQVKTALLLAGLNAKGTTRIIEKNKTRDHFEKIAGAFGIKLTAGENSKKEYEVEINGRQEVKPANVSIAGDISTAAFYITLDILIKKVYGLSLNLKIKNALLNDTRTGFFKTLEKAGIIFKYSNFKNNSGELSADIQLAGFKNEGEKINALKITSPKEIVAMIDEIPLLALILCFAEGVSTIERLTELRIKESDRLSAIYDNLSALKAGITVKDNDSIEIQGIKKLKGAVTDSGGDHRMAMMLCIAGFLCGEKFKLKNIDCIGVSNPNFFNDLKKIGFEFKIEN